VWLVTGALFDYSDKEVYSAFVHEINRLNARQPKVKLTHESHKLNIDDSYSVSSASKKQNGLL
jgi:hypothetical protein